MDFQKVCKPVSDAQLLWLNHPVKDSHFGVRFSFRTHIREIIMDFAVTHQPSKKNIYVITYHFFIRTS